jgi:DNA-binding NarL/FixJ family response regulator
MNAPIRIVLVDDHLAVRTGLRQAIEAEPDLIVSGEASTGQAALLLLEPGTVDVLVLDLNLPDANGWALLEQLRTAQRLPPTLVLSASDEHMFARRLLRAGARGYLMKDEPLRRIVEAIRLVHRGTVVASYAIAGQLMKEALEKPEPHPVADTSTCGTLSDRELQILAMLSQGWRNKQIAEKLELNEKTVSTYKARMMEKLGVTSTAKLIERYRAQDTTPV